MYILRFFLIFLLCIAQNFSVPLLHSVVICSAPATSPPRYSFLIIYAEPQNHSDLIHFHYLLL